MFSESGMNEVEIKNEERWLLLRSKVYEEKVKDAFKLFRENDIEPILIKGWAAAREYPQKFRRIYSDIDLCVSTDLYKKGSELILRDEARQFNIDLHNGLRHLDTVDWNDLYENSRIVNIDDVPIRILRPEDHLRVLSVHWLTDGGAYKDRLLDLYYLIENNKKDFDWERCLGIVSKRRREWVCKIIGLVGKYYGLDVNGFSFFKEATDIPDWLIKALEREWSSAVPLKPIHTLLGNRSEFWTQIKKRFPPNAIQATIDMEGSFDDKPRFYYQFGSIFIRLKPSITRIYNALKINKKNK